jgi:hypothetical protein
MGNVWRMLKPGGMILFRDYGLFLSHFVLPPWPYDDPTPASIIFGANETDSPLSFSFKADTTSHR